MSLHHSKLTRHGQATIPAAIRKSLGLAPGDEVQFELEEDRVILKKIQPFDVAYLQALDQELCAEWDSVEDSKAYDDL